MFEGWSDIAKTHDEIIFFPNVIVSLDFQNISLILCIYVNIYKDENICRKQSTNIEFFLNVEN